MKENGFIKEHPYNNFRVANKRNSKSKTYFVEEPTYKRFKSQNG